MMSNSKTKWDFLAKNPQRMLVAAVVIGLVVIVVLWLRSLGSADESVSEMATFEVKQGPLIISVTESGTIKAREQVILKSEVQGRTTILTLIPEGTRVKEGDLLVELDAGALLDQKVDHEIRLQNTEAAYISEQENLAVVKNQAQSDIDEAEVKLYFAQLDRKKYLDPNTGEYRNEREVARADITLAEERLARAREKLEWSGKLYKEKYISQTELKADELAAKKEELDRQKARNKLGLLETFTHERKVKQLESDVGQAEMALERIRRKAAADVIRAEASLRAKESEYQRQQSKLDKNKEQTEKTKIYAPADGLAIYATSVQGPSFFGNNEPLAEGQDVHERQRLIYLPKGTSVKAEVNIHESSLKKVRKGLPVVITVDALPGKSFVGEVVHIAPLPDAQSVWMNPDLKVYNTEINLDGNDGSLRTGMSCKTEIIVERYTDAVYVPVQAVLQVRGESTVYVVKGKDYEPRVVKMGLDNNRMVHIVSGLEAGEVVLLTPPLKSASVEVGGEEATFEIDHAEEGAEAADKKISEGLKDTKRSEQKEETAGPNEGKQDDNLSPETREKLFRSREEASQ